MAVLIENPFPAEAVAAFEDNLRTELLVQMEAATKSLNDYLAAYVVDEARYGGAIGIIGAFGDGKTHLLSWLRSQTLALQNVRCTVLYAKADGPSLLGVYRLFMDKVGRQRLNELRNLALKSIALARTAETKATESVAPRIEASQNLTQLAGEGNVDAERVALELERQLREDGTSEAFLTATRAIGLPQIGEFAYRWLAAHEEADPKAIGLLHSLAHDGAGEDDAALRGITYLAALHRVARVPLVMMIDQLEVLVPDMDQERVAAISSSIKKAIEQSTREAAFLIVAGTPEAWARLPVDARKRFQPGPMSRLGQLTVEESGALLGAYGRPSGATFDPETIRLLHDLSGGSPRELLRIAHQAFAASNGRLQGIERETVVASAESSGTVEERVEHAKTASLAVLKRHGVTTETLLLEKDLSVDFALEKGSRLLLAVELMPACTKIAEARAAKRVAAILNRLRTTHPGAALLVVPIGYATAELADLISREAVVVAFDEFTFSERLDAAVRDAIASRENAAADSPLDPGARFDELRKDLNRVEQTREKETEVVANAFAENIAAIGGGQRTDRTGRTKQELVEELDRVRQALETHQPWREHDLMRSILISNELGARDDFINHAGGLYIDLVNFGTRASAGSRAESTRTMADIAAAARYREDIVRLMIRRLRGRETPLEMAAHVGPLWGMATGIVVALIFATLVLVIVPSLQPSTASKLSAQQIAMAIFIGVIAGGLAGLFVTYLLRVRTALRHIEGASRRFIDRSYNGATSNGATS